MSWHRSESMRNYIARAFLILILAVAVAGSAAGDAPTAQGSYTPVPLDPYLIIDEFAPSGSVGESDYLYSPGSVALDEQGTIYVLDSRNHRVVAFSSSGKHLYSFGQRGDGPGEFRFGRDGGDDITLAGDKIITLEKQLGKIQIFDRRGEYVSSFSFYSRATAATSMGADESSIYIGVAARAAGEPTIVEFGYDGSQKSSLGSAQFSVNLRLYNMHTIAIDDRGRVRQAFRFFPLLRTFDKAGEMVDRWYDLSWWENRKLVDYYLSGRDRREAFESLGVGGAEADRRWPDFSEIPADLRFRTLFQDIEYLEGAKVWVALMSGGVLQGFSDKGEPLEAYALGVPNDREHRSGARDFGATPDGTTLCTADIRDSVVKCFQVADGWS